MRDALAAAQAWGGVRPTAMLSTDVPTAGDWSEADRLLAAAWSIDRAALCPCGCGFYRDESMDPESEGWFRGEAVICWAGAARDALNSTERKRPHGEMVYVRRLEDGEE